MKPIQWLSGWNVKAAETVFCHVKMICLMEIFFIDKHVIDFKARNNLGFVFSVEYKNIR